MEPIEFQKGIYCLKFNLDSKIYIGSTQRCFLERLEEHIRSAKSECGNQLFRQLLNTYGLNNLSMYVIESLQQEIGKREKYWINFLKKKNSTHLLMNKALKGNVHSRKTKLKPFDLKEICQLKNVINNRIFISSNYTLNSFKPAILEKLENNIHCNKKLQEDFNLFGKNAFEFSVLKIVANKDNFKEFYTIRQNLSPDDYTSLPEKFSIKSCSIESLII